MAPVTATMAGVLVVVLVVSVVVVVLGIVPSGGAELLAVDGLLRRKDSVLHGGRRADVLAGSDRRGARIRVASRCGPHRDRQRSHSQDHPRDHSLNH